jgi:ribonuclease E
MLDSEPSNRETDNNESSGHAAVPAAATAPASNNAPVAPAIPAAVFQPPQVLFQPPAAAPAPASAAPVADDRPEPEAEGSGRTGRSTRTRTRSTAAAKSAAAAADASDGEPAADADAGRPARRTRGGRGRGRVRDTAPDDDLFSVDSPDSPDVASAVAEAAEAVSDPYPSGGDEAEVGEAGGADETDEGTGSRRSRRRRNSRTSRTSRTGRSSDSAAADDGADGPGGSADDADADADGDGDSGDDGYGEGGASGRRRRRKRRRGTADTDVLSPDDPPDTVVHVREPHNPQDDVRAIKGSTRLEAKKQRRREGRESGRRRPPVITESEFLARRESVERTMVVRQRGDRTQIAVLEDDVLVEHYVNRTSHQSYVGNVYLGKVQNVLPSMEAAFVDIGKGRNAVLYAGEVNFDASGLEGQPKRIESALKAGQSVIVQVTKDPVGHKGARLTSQISLPGRYLVYVPGASMTGISRKLPENERTRLKAILKKVTPEHAGVIVRTAAEGAAETELDLDITRLAAQWETIEKKSKTATSPALLHGEPDLTVRVIRDVFNEDFAKLIVSGDEGWEIIDEYVKFVAPHLAERITRWDHDDDPGDDVFARYRIDEQLAKALERKVWLPSGGSLVIDRTEAMTVIDVNTGKFTGQGGNLEETVTRNNLEAAEEIVRQLRLRDVGGIVVIDFIDMVLESNRELVLRRLLECLARDRTKHQVAEVTSLGLVQMTRKRVGAGLLEAFSQQCECCNGRGVILTLEAPAETAHRSSAGTARRPVPVPAPPPRDPDSNGHSNGGSGSNGNGRGRGNGSDSRSGNGRSGNRRSGGRSDNDWRSAETIADDAARADAALADVALADAALDGGVLEDAALSGALDSTTFDSTTFDSSALDTAPLDTNALDNAALDSATRGDARVDDAAPSARNGGRRTRRPTNGGTAFAAAVQVEDSGPVQVTMAPAVTTAPDAQPEPAGLTPVAVGASGAPAAPEDAGPPVRRTRAGSAVARVTVVADPAPAPEPALEPTALQIPVAFPEIMAEPYAPAAEPDATAESATVAEPETVAAAPETIAAEPDATAEPVTVVEPEAAPESVTLVEPEATSAEPVAAPVEPEATLTKFVTWEPEPLAIAEPEAPTADTPSAPENPSDASTPAAPDAVAATEDPATPVNTGDAAPSDTSEAPIAQPEPDQAPNEE